MRAAGGTLAILFRPKKPKFRKKRAVYFRIARARKYNSRISRVERNAPPATTNNPLLTRHVDAILVT